MLLPSKRSKLAVDVAYVQRCQEAVPVSFSSLDLGEAVLVILLENLPGGNSSKYPGANPLLEVRRHCWSVLESDPILSDAIAMSCVPRLIDVSCMLDPQLDNAWPAVQPGDLELCLTSPLSGVTSGFAADSAAFRTLLFQSMGRQAAKDLRTTAVMVCRLRQNGVGLRPAEAAWLIAFVSPADIEAISTIN